MDAGFNKIANALMLEVRVGNETRRNVVFDKPSEGARWDAEDFRGPIVVYVHAGRVRAAQRVITSRRISRRSPCPKASGGATNEKELIDSVALGKETFHSVGCEACHLVAPSETAVSSGPESVRAVPRPRRARAKSPKAARVIASR